MININAATINPSTTGRKNAKNVNIKQPNNKKTYITIFCAKRNFFANPSLYTSTDSRKMIKNNT